MSGLEARMLNGNDDFTAETKAADESPPSIEDVVDDTLEASFPASDPPFWTLGVVRKSTDALGMVYLSQDARASREEETGALQARSPSAPAAHGPRS